MPTTDIAKREPEHPNAGNFLRDIVFGINDGVVTIIGFVVGISGSVSNQSVVAIAGVLSVVAGSASMALGNYLAVKSQREFHDQMERIERWEMENKPDVERKEIEEIYQNMGFSGKELAIITDKVTSDKELWLKVMMRDELGLTQEENEKPVLSGIIIGLCFFVGGSLPVLPFVLVQPLGRALTMSFFVAIVVMVFIGAMRWFLNKGSLGGKIVETIIIGLLAAGVGFVAGEVLNFLGISGITL